jgi:hypothetical protein
VLTGVAVVETGRRRAAEDERGQGLAGCRVNGDRPAWRVVHQHVVRIHLEVVLLEIMQWHRGDIEPHVPHELRLGAERQPAHGGMQPVGTDDQVEPAALGMLECNIYTTRVIIQRYDRITENEFGVIAARVEEGRGEIAAWEFHFAASGRPSQCAQVDPAGAPALGVEKAERPHVRRRLPKARQYAHSLGDEDSVAAHVHRASAGPQPAGAFHDRWRESGPGQPVSQR